MFDTNVLLAASISPGLCEKVFVHCLKQHTLVISQPILDEFVRHLSGKFRDQAGDSLETALATFHIISLKVEPVPLPGDTCRDANDIMVLGTAIAGHADYIITGDKDLLDLREFKGIPIVSPRQFHDRMI